MGIYISRIIIVIVIVTIILLPIKIKKYKMSYKFYRKIFYGSIMLYIITTFYAFENLIGFETLDQAIKYSQIKKPLLIETNDEVAYTINHNNDVVKYYKENNKWKLYEIFVKKSLSTITSEHKITSYIIEEKNSAFIIYEEEDYEEELTIIDKYNNQYKKAIINNKEIYYTIVENDKIDLCPKANGKSICRKEINY